MKYEIDPELRGIARRVPYNRLMIGLANIYLPTALRLTPRHRYPAAYEDILALYRYILDNEGELRADTERIALAGDSAGGYLAALICCNYQREGLGRPCAQMLVYPLTDTDMDTESMRKYTDTPLWNAVSNRKMWEYCCGGRGDVMRAASPLRCPLPDRVPDTYIETAEFDCLHDQGILYGERLRRAGAKVSLNETVGTIHGYDCAINAAISISNVQKRIGFLADMFKNHS